MKYYKLLRIVFMLCFLGLSVYSKAAPDPNFHIYICWGQSNMEGNATVPQAETKGVSDRFKLLYSANDCGQCSRKKGQWCTATPPLARCFHWNNSGFGPVDYFGRTLVEKLDPNIRVGVIVVACGGADIQLFEKNNYKAYMEASTTADWLKGYANSYGGNPYGRIIEMAKKAQQEGVIKGILVHQGETNNGQATWPSRLKGIYEDMLTDLNLKASEVPLLVGEVRHDGACSGHNNTIAKVPSVIPTAHVISSQGCESSGDSFHFSVAGYKLLGQRYANKMLELLEKSGALEKNLLLSATVKKEQEPGEVEITVNVENNAIQKVDIYADNQIIASNQRSFIWKNIAKGKHTIWAVGYDSSNKQYKTEETEVTIFEEQKPFNGTPFMIPGRIEAEEFDFGGEGNAYHDLDEQNRNGNTRNEGVDMSATVVGYMQVGEWLEYTVEIAEDGDYVVESRVASQDGTGQFTLYLDDNFIIPGEDGTPNGFVDVPATGDYSKFTTISTKLKKLTKGTHVLKLEVTGDWFDIDYMDFQYIEPVPQTPFNGTPASIPGKIEAEEFDFGGEGNAYHDLDEQNRNGDTRNEGVDMSATAVGYAQAGEWLEYTVEVKTAGIYEVEASVASEGTSGSFTLYMDDECIIPDAKSVSVPNTGSFSTFEIVKSSLEKLTKGVHVLKLEITGSWFDIDNLNFKLLKADETTDLELDEMDKKSIPNGVYNAFDAVGRFINVVTVENSRTKDLNMGFYILRGETGKAYSMMVGK